MKKKLDYDQLIYDLEHHPIKMFFKYPLGKNDDEVQWDELFWISCEIVADIGLLIDCIVMLILQKLILRGILRPFYKMYCIYASRQKMLKRRKKHEVSGKSERPS